MEGGRRAARAQAALEVGRTEPDRRGDRIPARLSSEVVAVRRDASRCHGTAQTAAARHAAVRRGSRTSLSARGARHLAHASPSTPGREGGNVVPRGENATLITRGQARELTVDGRPESSRRAGGVSVRRPWACDEKPWDFRQMGAGEAGGRCRPRGGGAGGCRSPPGGKRDRRRARPRSGNTRPTTPGAARASRPGRPAMRAGRNRGRHYMVWVAAARRTDRTGRPGRASRGPAVRRTGPVRSWR